MNARLRTAALGGALALLAVALIVGGVAVNRSADHGPTGTPASGHQPQTEVSPEETPPAREIVYSDIAVGPVGLPIGDSIHFGDRVIDTGVGFTQIDVTDDGFVYTAAPSLTDGAGPLWFSDGGGPQQIASNVCHDEPGFPGTQVITGSVGSLAAWFECAGAEHAALVVFDTGLGHELARLPLERCARGHAASSCHPDAVIGDHVYFERTYFLHGGSGHVAYGSFVFDVSTGRLSEVRSSALRADIRGNPRGLVVGDSFQTGISTTGIQQRFIVVGPRLIPLALETEQRVAGGLKRSTAFDTGTGQALALHLPSGYQSADIYQLFEWIDDDTVALVGPAGWGEERGYGDILSCTLSDGRCVLAVGGRGPLRVVPQVGLPG
jgi:hypothetical protein